MLCLSVVLNAIGSWIPAQIRQDARKWSGSHESGPSTDWHRKTSRFSGSGSTWCGAPPARRLFLCLCQKWACSERAVGRSCHPPSRYPAPWASSHPPSRTRPDHQPTRLLRNTAKQAEECIEGRQEDQDHEKIGCSIHCCLRGGMVNGGG